MVAIFPLAVAAVVVLLAARWIAAYVRFRRLELAIPGPASLPLLGNALDVLGVTDDTIRDKLLGLWGERYTTLSRASLFNNLFVSVTDPDDIEELLKCKETQDKSWIIYNFMSLLSRKGLVTLNGPEWRAHRKAIQPAFHPELLDRFVDVFVEESLAFAGRVRDGESQDVIRNLRHSASAAFVRTALVCDLDDAQRSSVEHFLDFLENFMNTVATRSLRPWFWSDAAFGLTSLARKLRQLKDKIDEFSSAVIANRRRYLQEHKDVGEQDFVKPRRTLIDILVGGFMSDKEIQDEFNIFLAAAVETTVASLGWTLKVLSVRPDVQDKILEEVKEVLGGDAKAVTPQTLAKLEYTECVIKESLRLLPTVPIVARINRQEFQLSGYTIPEGTTIIVNIYGAHRHPAHWDAPLTFDPERFRGERGAAARHPYAFMPFSTGPRNCIGSRYAMMLIKTMLAVVLATHRVDPVDDGLTDPVAFPYTLDVASRMPGGVHVVLSRRRDAAEDA